MPLTILTDHDVRNLLLKLTQQDILALQQSLADALHHYSTATEDDTSNGCASSYQPLRTSLKRGDGQTTLLMPASSNEGMGVKIVTLASVDSKAKENASEVSSLSAQSTTPKGSLTLFDAEGRPRALLNAEEITAFRTALASTMLFKKRKNVHNVVVFGAGKQAYWHVRLALLLRGEDVHHLTVINRDFARAHSMLSKLWAPNDEPRPWSGSLDDVPVYRQPTSPSGEGQGADLPHPKHIQILTPSHPSYPTHLKTTLRSSSVIFTTTPSLTPLFPAEILTNPGARNKGRYIAAVGSYKPHMLELAPEIIRQNVSPAHSAHQQAIVVDSIEACLAEAGEVIQANIGPEQVVELGELVMLKRDADRRRAECEARKREEEGLDDGGVELGKAKRSKNKWGKKTEEHGEDKAHRGLVEWLQKGNVIYKSVGLGLMDVVVGMDLVRLADERGVGTGIEDF